jgi:8-amino-7-oxononanoate synthase
LERWLADWLEVDDALVFSSGYAANTGTLSALAGPDDLIVSDALNHASIIDGARLSRARVVVTPHCDTDAVRRALHRRREAHALVVTESYFSMDADAPDLRLLRAICDAEGAALVVDEAHAMGVLGPDGRGLAAEAGIAPDVTIGTLGKAFGTAGAFAAGSHTLVQWLWNRARSFVFSTGMSPLVAAAALDSLVFARETPQRREGVLQRSVALREGLQNAGVEAAGFGHIVPWIIGDVRATAQIAHGLQGRGVHVLPIRPPSVPRGTARLRFTVTARHTAEDIARAVSAVCAEIR